MPLKEAGFKGILHDYSFAEKIGHLTKLERFLLEIRLESEGTFCATKGDRFQGDSA